MKRVLVCGGRGYTRRDLVWTALDRLHAGLVISTVIHGGATGADNIAGDWAKENGVAVEAYPIETGEGGFNRNTRMLVESEPEMVIHFPGGNGTADMVAKARESGVEVQGGLELARAVAIMWEPLLDLRPEDKVNKELKPTTYGRKGGPPGRFAGLKKN